MKLILVENLKAGDLVDLETCPYLYNHPLAGFEYAEVTSVKRETPSCVAVAYEGVDVVGYEPGTWLLAIPAEERNCPPAASHCAV